MRGSSSFEKLYQNPNRKNKKSADRRSDLIEQRNELIMYRYHYYGAHSGQRYDEVVKSLCNEFYLSVRQINKIIERHTDVSRRILEEKPSLTKLRKKYAFLTW